MLHSDFTSQVLCISALKNAVHKARTATAFFGAVAGGPLIAQQS
jgi:hypothetical protein